MSRKMRSRVAVTGIICLLLAGCGSEQKTSLPEAESETIKTAAGAEVSEPDQLTTTQEAETKTGESGKPDHVKMRLGWEPGKLKRLDEIQVLLDESGIRYTGFYNESEERLDMKLEDGTSLIFLEVSDDTSDHQYYELMMMDNQWNQVGFQEDYLHQYDVTADEEFYPDTKDELIDEGELWKLNQTDFSIARNQIYARHGRIFKDPFLNAIFMSKNWYHPTYSAEEFEQLGNPFSEIEKKNLKIIVDYEKTRWGHQKPDGKPIEPVKKLLSGSSLDLDGDGTLEQVRYQLQADSYGDGKYTLKIGTEAAKAEGISLYRYLGLVSLDKNTNLLLAGGSGPSDDPWNDYYIYREGNLDLAGQLPGSVRGYEDGMIYVSAQTDHFQTFITSFTYELDRQEYYLKEIPELLYPYGNTVVAKQDIVLYTDQSGTETGTVLHPGDQVTIVGSDLQHWVKVEKEATGESGWIRCDYPYICTLPDGSQVDSDDLFEGLLFFG